MSALSTTGPALSLLLTGPKHGRSPGAKLAQWQWSTLPATAIHGDHVGKGAHGTAPTVRLAGMSSPFEGARGRARDNIQGTEEICHVLSATDVFCDRVESIEKWLSHKGTQGQIFTNPHCLSVKRLAANQSCFMVSMLPSSAHLTFLITMPLKSSVVCLACGQHVLDSVWRADNFLTLKPICSLYVWTLKVDTFYNVLWNLVGEAASLATCHIAEYIARERVPFKCERSAKVIWTSSFTEIKMASSWYVLFFYLAKNNFYFYVFCLAA